jgi:hypothetical protein
VSWSPLSLGSTLKLWLRGDLGIHLTSSAVDTWADQSGNANNATQPTSAQRPVQSTTIGGQSCVSFSGSTGLRLPNFVTAGAKSVAIVYKINVAPTGITQTLTLINAAATLQTGFFLKQTGATPNRAWCADMSIGTTMIGTGVTADTAAHMDFADWNGTAPAQTAANNEIFHDGIVQTLGTGFFNTPVLTDFSSIGAKIDSTGALTLGTNVDIAEIIVTDTQLSVSDRRSFEAYVRARYGILAIPEIWGISVGQSTGHAAMVGTSWSPLTLGSTTLKLWLRGDLGIHLTSGNVDTWADQSGNGNDATQATSGQRPATNTVINGQTCVNFTGSVGLQMPNFISAGAKTIIVVRKWALATGINMSLLLLESGSTETKLSYASHDISAPYSPLQFYCDWTTSINGISTALAFDASPKMEYVDYNGGTNTSSSSYNAYINSMPAALSAGGLYGDGTITNKTAIGGRINSAGVLTSATTTACSVAELIVCSRQLSAAERNSVALYIFNRYNIGNAAISVGQAFGYAALVGSGLFAAHTSARDAPHAALTGAVALHPVVTSQATSHAALAGVAALHPIAASQALAHASMTGAGLLHPTTAARASTAALVLGRNPIHAIGMGQATEAAHVIGRGSVSAHVSGQSWAVGVPTVHKFLTGFVVGEERSNVSLSVNALLAGYVFGQATTHITLSRVPYSTSTRLRHVHFEPSIRRLIVGGHRRNEAGILQRMPTTADREMPRSDTLFFLDAVWQDVATTQVFTVPITNPTTPPPPGSVPFNLTGCRIICTVKKYVPDPDQAAVMQMDNQLLGGVTIVSAVQGTFAVTGPAQATVQFPDSEVVLVFDIQITTVGGNIITIEHGKLFVPADITRTF